MKGQSTVIAMYRRDSVDIGSDGWLKQPAGADGKFAYILSLESDSGVTKNLTVNINADIINQDFRTSVTLNLGQCKTMMYF